MTTSSTSVAAQTQASMDVIFADFNQELEVQKRLKQMPRQQSKHYDHIIMSVPLHGEEDGEGMQSEKRTLESQPEESLSSNHDSQRQLGHAVSGATTNEKSIRALLNLNHQQMLSTENIFIAPAETIDVASSHDGQDIHKRMTSDASFEEDQFRARFMQNLSSEPKEAYKGPTKKNQQARTSNQTDLESVSQLHQDNSKRPSISKISSINQCFNQLKILTANSDTDGQVVHGVLVAAPIKVNPMDPNPIDYPTVRGSISYDNSKKSLNTSQSSSVESIELYLRRNLNQTVQLGHRSSVISGKSSERLNVKQGVRLRKKNFFLGNIEMMTMHDKKPSLPSKKVKFRRSVIPMNRRASQETQKQSQEAATPSKASQPTPILQLKTPKYTPVQLYQTGQQIKACFPNEIMDSQLSGQVKLVRVMPHSHAYASPHSGLALVRVRNSVKAMDMGPSEIQAHGRSIQLPERRNSKVTKRSKKNLSTDISSNNTYKKQKELHSMFADEQQSQGGALRLKSTLFGSTLQTMRIKRIEPFAPMTKEQMKHFKIKPVIAHQAQQKLTSAAQTSPVSPVMEISSQGSSQKRASPPRLETQLTELQKRSQNSHRTAKGQHSTIRRSTTNHLQSSGEKVLKVSNNVKILKSKATPEQVAEGNAEEELVEDDLINYDEQQKKGQLRSSKNGPQQFLTPNQQQRGKRKYPRIDDCIEEKTSSQESLEESGGRYPTFGDSGSQSSQRRKKELDVKMQQSNFGTQGIVPAIVQQRIQPQRFIKQKTESHQQHFPQHVTDKEAIKRINIKSNNKNIFVNQSVNETGFAEGSEADRSRNTELHQKLSWPSERNLAKNRPKNQYLKLQPKQNPVFETLRPSINKSNSSQSSGGNSPDVSNMSRINPIYSPHALRTDNMLSPTKASPGNSPRNHTQIQLIPTEKPLLWHQPRKNKPNEGDEITVSKGEILRQAIAAQSQSRFQNKTARPAQIQVYPNNSDISALQGENGGWSKFDSLRDDNMIQTQYASNHQSKGESSIQQLKSKKSRNKQFIEVKDKHATSYTSKFPPEIPRGTLYSQQEGDEEPFFGFKTVGTQNCEDQVQGSPIEQTENTLNTLNSPQTAYDLSPLFRVKRVDDREAAPDAGQCEPSQSQDANGQQQEQSKTLQAESQSRRGLNTDHIPSELMRKGVISQTMQVLLSGRQRMHTSILEQVNQRGKANKTSAEVPSILRRSIVQTSRHNLETQPVSQALQTTQSSNRNPIMYENQLHPQDQKQKVGPRRAGFVTARAKPPQQLQNQTLRSQPQDLEEMSSLMEVKSLNNSSDVNGKNMLASADLMKTMWKQKAKIREDRKKNPHLAEAALTESPRPRNRFVVDKVMVRSKDGAVGGRDFDFPSKRKLANAGENPDIRSARHKQLIQSLNNRAGSIVDHSLASIIMDNRQKNLLLRKSSSKENELIKKNINLIRSLRKQSNNTTQVYPHVMADSYNTQNVIAQKQLFLLPSIKKINTISQSPSRKPQANASSGIGSTFDGDKNGELNQDLQNLQRHAKKQEELLQELDREIIKISSNEQLMVVMPKVKISSTLLSPDSDGKHSMLTQPKMQFNNPNQASMMDQMSFAHKIQNRRDISQRMSRILNDESAAVVAQQGHDTKSQMQQ